MKIIVFFLIVICFSLQSFAQQDSIEMSNDLGVGAMRNVKLWPLIEVLNSKDKKEVNFLFSIYGSAKTYKPANKQFHIMPFCWYDSSSGFRDVRLLSFYYPSFFHYTKNETSETRSLKVFEIAPHISLLEFTKSNDGFKVDNNALFFLWQRVDSVEHKSSLVVFPLYWQFKNPLQMTATFLPFYRKSTYNHGLSSYLAVTPLFWHFETILSVDELMYPNGNKRTSNTLFPIYWAHRDENTNKHVLFPFLWQYKNPTYHSFTLLPLWSSGASADSTKSHLMLSPFFWHLKNRNTSNTILFPIWWHNNKQIGKNKSLSNYIFPSFWNYKDTSRSQAVLFPFWFSHNKPLSVSHTLVPLFSVGHSKDNNYKHLMLTPLFWKMNSIYKSSITLIPIFRTTKVFTSIDTIRRTVLFPIVWNYHDKFKSSTCIFPILWTRRDSLSSSTSILPFLSVGHNADKTKNHLMLTPLFWHIKNKDRYTNLFFPFVWDFKTKTYHSFTLFPLVSFGKSYMQAKSYLMLSPLFWHTVRHDKIKNILFPLVWNSTTGIGKQQTKNTLIVPIYFSHSQADVKRKVLFPIVWTYKDSLYRTFTLLPLVSYGKYTLNKDNYLAITPLFWHISYGYKVKNVLFPIYWDIKKDTGLNASHLKLILPIYGAFKNKSLDHKIVFPLVWSLKTPYYQSFTFIPFVSTGHTPNMNIKHLTVTPLFWRNINNGDTSNLLLPIWWNTKQGQGKSKWTAKTLFPIYWTYKDSITDNKILLPFIWNMKNGNYQSLTIFPFYSKGQTTDTSFKHTAISPIYWRLEYGHHIRKILFPLYFYHKEKNTYSDRTWNTLFPIYFAYKDSTKSNKLLFPILWSFKNSNSKFFSFMPFFSIGENLSSNLKYFSITPFYWSLNRNNREKVNVLFPIVWSFSNNYNEQKEHRLVVFPILWYYHYNKSTSTVLFPIVWYRNKANEFRFSIYPLFDYKKTDSLNSRLMITPFYWHINKPTYSQNIIFPFWWGKNYKEKVLNRRKMIYPFYFAVRDSNRDNTVIAPLYWSFKNKNYSSKLLLPLLSVGNSPDKTRSHLMLTPLFWHSQKYDEYRNLLFPIWWNKSSGEGAEKRTTNIVAPLYFSRYDRLRQTQILLPLVYRFKNPFYQSFSILPLLSIGHTPDRLTSHLVITPLFWNIHYIESHANLLFPIYSYYKDTTHLRKFNFLQFVYRFKQKLNRRETSILWPLIEYQSDVDYKYFRFSPLYWHKKDRELEYSYLPFLYHHRIDQVAESKQFLLWFYSMTREYGVKKSRSYFWFLSRMEQYENGDYDTRFAHYLYINKSINGNTDKAFFPFFHTSKSTNGNYFHSGFLAFNSSFKKQLNGSNEFYQEKKTLWLVRTKSNYKSLKDRDIIKDRRELRQRLLN